MSMNRNDRETLRAIRARARQLRGTSDQGQDQMLADAEVLAAWRDGSLSFDDIPDDVLARLIQKVGGASAARMLTRISDEVPSVESDQAMPGSADRDIQDLEDAAAPPPPSPVAVSRPKSWWSHQGKWLAAAASVAFVTTVVYKLIPSQLPEVVPLPPVASVAPSLHVEWPSAPPFNPQQLTAWATPRVNLPTAMPDYKKRAGGTLGATKQQVERRSEDVSAELGHERLETLRPLGREDRLSKDYSAVLNEVENTTILGTSRRDDQPAEGVSTRYSPDAIHPDVAISTADRFRYWREATVIVQTEEGWGSGAIVSADGWILTTYQVVQIAAQRAALEGEAARVKVITGQQGEGPITPQPAIEGILYRADPIHDLALLKLEKFPAGRKTLSYFKLAEEIKVDEDCYITGSQQNSLAWWLRAGNVSKVFNYPEDQTQPSSSIASREPRVDRTVATLVVSDIRSSPGDSGGPLLNAQGDLVGITTALSSLPIIGGAASWHIALKHVQAFLRNLPDRPEGIPFDVWTMGNPQATLLTPHLVDADGDTRIDTLQMPYAVARQAKGSSPVSEPMAIAVLIDFAQRSTSTENDRHRVPLGLWGMENRGEFRFDMLVGMRADGVVITGYTGSNGELDEIRIGKGNAEQASLLWQKEPDGKWRSTKPTDGVKLLDPAKIGEANAQWVVSRMDRLMSIRGADSSENTVGSKEQ